ncbi:hypothetical protein L1887_10673 [Cichorium endivia]|nr:hypothetical protein L1887_10673 [Cichorium endivia]
MYWTAVIEVKSSGGGLRFVAQHFVFIYDYFSFRKRLYKSKTLNPSFKKFGRFLKRDCFTSLIDRCRLNELTIHTWPTLQTLLNHQMLMHK